MSYARLKFYMFSGAEFHIQAPFFGSKALGEQAFGKVNLIVLVNVFVSLIVTDGYIFFFGCKTVFSPDVSGDDMFEPVCAFSCFVWIIDIVGPICFWNIVWFTACKFGSLCAFIVPTPAQSSCKFRLDIVYASSSLCFSWCAPFMSIEI